MWLRLCELIEGKRSENKIIIIINILCCVWIREGDLQKTEATCEYNRT